MKKIILLMVAILMVALVNAQTQAGRKAGEGQRDYIPAKTQSKKPANKSKKAKSKKPSRKSSAVIRAKTLDRTMSSAKTVYYACGNMRAKVSAYQKRSVSALA